MTARRPAWMLDEAAGMGRGLGTLRGALRQDHEAEASGEALAAAGEMLAWLAPKPGESLLEIGCGTGFLAVEAAQRCARVTACDVSGAALRVARAKARALGLRNLRFQRAGFLTFRRPRTPFDMAASALTLHHLPDFWKGVALARLADAMAPGGRLCLYDLSYGFGPEAAMRAIPAALRGCPRAVRAEAADHFAREHGTYAWIVRGLLARAGFRVARHRAWPDMPTAHWLCVRE